MADLAAKAKEAFIDDHFELAVDYYSQAIALDPESSHLFSDRSQANIKLNNFTVVDLAMEEFNLLEGNGLFNDVHTTQSDVHMTQVVNNGGKQLGNEEKKAAVHEEIKKVNLLPAHSTYATHRMRVLNKILQLLSVQAVILYHFHEYEKCFSILERLYHNIQPIDESATSCMSLVTGRFFS